MKVLSLLLVLCALMCLASAQVPIPNRPDGYALSPAAPASAPVVLEAFFDLLCPDSKAAWPTIKQLLAAYPSQLYFLMHTFPLPYHTWSFIANEGAHVIDSLTGGDLTAVRAYTDLLFDIQDKYYNAATSALSTLDVQKKLAADVKAVYADSDRFLLELQNNTDLNEETRVSWKYGCSRSISGTPSFLLNGVFIDADASWALSDWQSVIDPILNATSARLLTTHKRTHTTQHSQHTQRTAHHSTEPVAAVSATLSKVTFPQQPSRWAANTTCPSGETVCEYEPKKFECCLKGENCIKNVGCRCARQGGC